MDFPIPALYNEEKTEEAHAMMEIQIRRYQEADTEPLTALIRQNLLAVNIRDYPAAELEALANAYHTERLRQIAASTHFMLPAWRGALWDAAQLHPDGNPAPAGYKRYLFIPSIMETALDGVLWRRWNRIRWRWKLTGWNWGASKTAHGFYLALGYTDLSGQPDQHGLYQMGKRLGGL